MFPSMEIQVIYSFGALSIFELGYLHLGLGLLMLRTKISYN